MDWTEVEFPYGGNDGWQVERAPVPGGWLYRAAYIRFSWDRSLQQHDATVVAVTMTFVPEATNAPS